MEANEEAKQVDPHRYCFVGDCEVGDQEHCPKEAIRRAREATMAPAWGELELRKDPGGLRHYLEGRAVHCGVTLELQDVEARTDEHGDFSARLTTGRFVRYEATWRDGELPFTLHTDVGGHEFVARGMVWMRFQWPKPRGLR